MAAGPYMTAKRFRLGGFGIDLSDFSDVELTATLRRATTLVNTWVNGSQVPHPFDFRGGLVENEQHIFPIPNPLTPYPGSRRVFPNNRPLQSVTKFWLQFTNNQELDAGYRIELNVDTDIFVNWTESWCEIVASQPTIIGYPPIGYWFGTYQPIALISYTYGYLQPVVDDPCEAETPNLYWASFGQWADAPETVKIDGVEQDSGYTVNPTDGSIKFVTPPLPNASVTVSYSASLPDAVVQATGLIAVDLIGQSRIASRGMLGIQSIKVAEVAITQMAQSGARYSVRNGVSIPDAAAAFLLPFVRGTSA